MPNACITQATCGSAGICFGLWMIDAIHQGWIRVRVMIRVRIRNRVIVKVSDPRWIAASDHRFGSVFFYVATRDQDIAITSPR